MDRGGRPLHFGTSPMIPFAFVWSFIASFAVITSQLSIPSTMGTRLSLGCLIVKARKHQQRWSH